MTEAKMTQLLALLEELVSESGPYREKRERLLAEANDEQKTALEEFAAWFEE